jgi:hypothetical protein
MVSTTRVITPPEERPVTLDQFKAWLRIDWPGEDEELIDILDASIDWMEQHLGRRLCTQTLESIIELGIPTARPHPIGEWSERQWASLIYPWQTSAIALPWAPIQSVTTVWLDQPVGTWTTLTDYRLDLEIEPPTLTLLTMTPSHRIKVRYAAGYADPSQVPRSIGRAILRVGAYLYENRESPDDAAMGHLVDPIAGIYRVLRI